MNIKIGVVCGSFHRSEVERMLEWSTDEADRQGIEIEDVIWVPGAMEVPLALDRLLSRDDIEGAACLGIIERGQTQHGLAMGHAVIKSITSNTVLTIASTEGLDPNLGVFATGYGATTFVVSQLPKSSTSDSSYKEPEDGYTKAVYAVNATNIDATSGTGIAADSAGWVGVTTYLQSDGTLRTKSEVLVAMSGISTGGRPKFPTPLDLA